MLWHLNWPFSVFSQPRISPRKSLYNCLWWQFPSAEFWICPHLYTPCHILNCCYVCAAAKWPPADPKKKKKNHTPYNVGFRSNGGRALQCFRMLVLSNLSDFGDDRFMPRETPRPSSQTGAAVWNRISSMWHANTASCLWYMRAVIDSVSQSASLILLMSPLPPPWVREGFFKELHDNVTFGKHQHHHAHFQGNKNCRSHDSRGSSQANTASLTISEG